MPKIIQPLMSFDASGAVAGVIVYRRHATRNDLRSNARTLRKHRNDRPPSATSAQAAQRAAWRARADAWHLATTEQRAVFQPIADRYKISLYSAWMTVTAVQTGVVWDTGATTWDTGTTTWPE